MYPPLLTTVVLSVLFLQWSFAPNPGTIPVTIATSLRQPAFAPFHCGTHDWKYREGPHPVNLSMAYGTSILPSVTPPSL
jgi:hypothetical protein